MDLINHKHVDTIIGTLTPEQAAFLSHLKTPPPIISLSPAASPPPQPPPPPSFNQMTLPAAHQIQCITSLVAHFRWKKLISISQEPSLFLPLSRALHALDISIDLHTTAASSIERDLMKMIGATSSRIFVVMHCSLEFATILFEKARVLGLTEKGFVWIVAEEISNLLDSADPSLLLNMEGALAVKSDYSTNHNSFKAFKSKFRRKFGSKYPSEENPTPSIYALRAYDAVFAGAGAGEDGLSGRIIFKNGFLSQKPVFRIVNVIGKSYREVAVWSPELGFSGDLRSIFWPGGERSVPRGWSLGSGERPLRIGVPARGAFNQFVKVTYDTSRNSTNITGFSIEVFEAAVKKLPYDLHYVLVPYYGSYDEMVAQVHNKVQLYY